MESPSSKAASSHTRLSCVRALSCFSGKQTQESPVTKKQMYEGKLWVSICSLRSFCLILSVSVRLNMLLTCSLVTLISICVVNVLGVLESDTCI